VAQLAPNLTALVGADLAARLLGVAGGVEALSLVPSCNLQVLGSERRALDGLGAAAARRNVGLLGQCDLVQSAPPDLRSKVLRLVAAKCTLAVHVDNYGTDVSAGAATTTAAAAAAANTQGSQWRAEIVEKIAALVRPAEHKKERALPVPDEKHGKQRAGRRYKRQREMRRVSEAQKLRSRVSFGASDGAVDDFTGAPLAAPLAVSAHAAASESDRPHKRPRIGESSASGATTTSTTSTTSSSSSLSLDSERGLEFVDHTASSRRAQESLAESRFFSSTAGFVRAAVTPGGAPSH
jgi:U4/U6 small nuclear ribonucleoprotein PRP31